MIQFSDTVPERQTESIPLSNILLTLSWRKSFPYRNQSIDLLCKSMEWFLYDRDIVVDQAKKLFQMFRCALNWT